MISQTIREVFLSRSQSSPLSRIYRRQRGNKAQPERGTCTGPSVAAMSAGEQGVLLVETDFRRPSVKTLLGTQPACGLVDYLLGEAEYARMFTTTQIPGLTVVHAGKTVKNPMGLFRSEKMAQFFTQLKAQTQYSHILLDTCPLLLIPDSMALIQYVDAAILVVRAGKTPREMVAQTIDVLGPEKLLGCVFNGITSSDAPDYGYYYKSDYYHDNDNTQY